MISWNNYNFRGLSSREDTEMCSSSLSELAERERVGGII